MLAAIQNLLHFLLHFSINNNQIWRKTRVSSKMRSLEAAVSLTTGNIRYSLYNVGESLRWYNMSLTCFSTP